MSRGLRVNSRTQQCVDAICPDQGSTVAQVAALTGMSRKFVDNSLYQRQRVGGITSVRGVWVKLGTAAWHRLAEPEAGKPRRAPPRWITPTYAAEQANGMHVTLTRRDTSWCAMAMPRAFVPQGAYHPPPTMRRAGADDYKRIPSRAGDQLLPFRHP